MMASIVWALATVELFLNPANDPQKACEVAWAKGYPSVNAFGLVEVNGTFKAGDGWAIKDAWFDFVPAEGGTVSEQTKLAFANGTWGESDVTGKIWPAASLLPKGEWNVRVRFVFEKKLSNGTVKTVDWQAATNSVEVK